MSIDFVAIDFETANQKRASACSVGLTKVLNGKIYQSYYSLINPETSFNPFNIAIHGIDENMVKDSPNYSHVILEIKEFIEDLPLVAHYAPFDMGVIRDSNDRYSINNFSAKYFDSYYLAKQYMTSISYKLDYLSDLIGVSFNHHNALDDSMACAKLIIYLCNEHNYTSIDELLSNAHYKQMGTVINSEKSGFKKNITRSKKQAQSDIQAIIDSIDEDALDKTHPFFKKHACFTGKLETMTRQSAMSLFAKIGGIPEKNVTKKVNYLVMGEQDFRIVGTELKSSKILKAEKLLQSGQDIQLLTENDFLKMIGETD